MKRRQFPGMLILAATMITALLLITPVCGEYVPPGGGGGSSTGSRSAASVSGGSSEITYATTAISGAFTPVGNGWFMTTFRNNLPISMIAFQTGSSVPVPKANTALPNSISPNPIPPNTVSPPGEWNSFQIQTAVMSSVKQAEITETLTKTPSTPTKTQTTVVINTTGMGPATIAVLLATGGDTSSDAYKKSVAMYQSQAAGKAPSGPVKITSITVYRDVVKAGQNENVANTFTESENTLKQTQDAIRKAKNDSDILRSNNKISDIINTDAR